MSASTRKESIELKLHHFSAEVPSNLAQGVLHTIHRIVQSITHRPNEALCDVESLSVQDKSQIFQWNERVPPALHQRLDEAFTEKALDNPDAPAISSWEGEWTYSELDDASNRLGKHLATLHTDSPASHTALLCSEKSYAGVLSLLAILKAGLTCVPQNPKSLSLRKVVEDVKPRLVCVSPAHAHQFTDFDGTVVIVDDDLLNRLEHNTETSITKPQRNNDIAFVQYTAGTTGLPKGVLQGHTGLYTGILAQGQALGYDIDSRVLHSNAYNTPTGISEIFGAFFYGGCVIIIPEEETTEALAEIINEQEATHACFTAAEAQKFDPMDLWQLRTIALTGGHLIQEDVEKWGLEMEMIRSYGTAETSVPISISKAPSPYFFEPSNIGVPLAASFWVVEQGNYDKLAPIGAIGELLVGGPTLALGYINSPKKDSAGFIVNPKWSNASSNDVDQHFFVTGDLFRHLGNGELVFCGRKESPRRAEHISEPHNRVENITVPPFSLLGSSELVEEALQAAVSVCGISSDMIEDIYPTTPMQESLFALSSKQAGAFMKQDVFELPVDLDLNRFRKAWELTVQQSPILRTRLFMTDSLRVLQAVVSQAPQCRDASSLESYIEEDLREPMLLGDPLFRYAICKTPNQPCHLVVTLHHALFDGWTLDLLFNRVKQNFDQSALTSVAPFSSFVKYTQSLDREKLSQFWVNQLDNTTTTVFPVLPTTSYQPTPNDTYTHQLNFRRALGSSTTVSTLVQAAWALTVAKYADIDDVTFGLTVSGRAASASGIMDMMGPTVTTVPVRSRVAKETKLGDFLEHLQHQSTATIPYEQTGIYRIKSLTSGTRNACSFQTALVIQPLDVDNGLEALGCRRVNDIHDSYQPYALNIEVGLRDGGGLVSVLFDDQVIDKLQVQRITTMFGEILRKISVDRSDIIIDEIATITPNDLDQLMLWNQPLSKPVPETLHGAFQIQALLNPTAPCIASWDGDFTYAELDSLSSRLAVHLITLGITLEMIVPLHFEKSKWSIVSMLAVLKAGGACLSFDVSHPPDRLRDMVKAVGGDIMLVGKAPPSKVIENVKHVITVDEALFETLKYQDIKRSELVRPNNRCFIVFTSGSTGNPKGIELEHQAACTSSRAYAAAVHIGPGSRCLQFSSFAFDVYITDVFAALMSGACCCIPSEEERMSHLPEAINKLEVNHVDITPTVASLLMPDAVPMLKSMVVGGEPVTVENARRWGDRVLLVNMYSQSETSNWVTHNVMLSGTKQPSNIGLGDGVSTWVVDQNNNSRLAPIGCVGELFVEGPVLARGYLNDPEKTRKSFVIDPPWLSTATALPRRLYRTGDLVRYNSDGTLVYAGRQDAQVKIRGQRLELSEVEHHLMESLYVKAGLAVLPRVGLCKGRCVAVLSLREFVKPGSGSMRMIDVSHRVAASAQLTGIRDHLSETLAKWMVPTFWVVVEDMPTNVSGKLDRIGTQLFVENLTENDFQQASDFLLDNHYQQPETSMEILLQEIWALVLKLTSDQVSATASFLRLGGDSITAMQVVSKCRTHGVTISVHDVLVSKSLSELATLADSLSLTMDPRIKVEQQAVSEPSVGTGLPQDPNTLALYDTILKQASLKASNIENVVRASDYQVSALEQTLLKFRGDLTYHTFDIPKPVNFNRLALSCVELVNSHPLLRSVFVCHERQVYQVTMKLSFVDLTKQVDELDLEAIIEHDQRQILSLGQPMVWFKLIQRSSSHSCDSLIMRLPHCLYDASTLTSLVAELQQAYFSSCPLKKPLDALHCYKFRDENRLKALEYWRRYLEGSTATQIVAKSEPRFQHGRQQTLSSKFHIKALKSHGITSATIAKAAWGYLLTDLCGQDDVVFGELVGGRGSSVAGIDGLGVVCASTSPLRMKIDSSWNVLDLLQDVQSGHLASMPYEFVGDASIVEACTPWPKWVRFGSVINHIPSLPTTDHPGHEEFKSTGICGNLNPSSDLNIQCHPLPVEQESDNNFQVQITFDEDHISPAFVNNILGRFCSLIHDFTVDVTSPLSRLRQGPIEAHGLPLGCGNGLLDESIALKLNQASSTGVIDQRALDDVRSVWETVIGKNDDLDTHFLSHWGSLIAAAHFAAAYAESGIEVSMEEILEAPTIRSQAVLCATRAKSGH